MKRHRALQPLSRDHHIALVAAQRLRRAAEGDATTAREAFLEFWHEHGADHFRIEEEVLLPTAAGWIDPEAECIVRMLVDHIRIRARRTPRTRGGAGARRAHHLDRRSSARALEEREVFPLIEAAMPEPEPSGSSASCRRGGTVGERVCDPLGTPCRGSVRWRRSAGGIDPPRAGTPARTTSIAR